MCKLDNWIGCSSEKSKIHQLKGTASLIMARGFPIRALAANGPTQPLYYTVAPDQLALHIESETRLSRRLHRDLRIQPKIKRSAMHHPALYLYHRRNWCPATLSQAGTRREKLLLRKENRIITNYDLHRMSLGLASSRLAIKEAWIAYYISPCLWIWKVYSHGQV